MNAISSGAESIFLGMLNTFRDFLMEFMAVGLWKLLLCVVIIAVALLLKGFISKCIFNLIKKKTAKSDGSESWVDTLLGIIDRPIRLVVITLAIYICSAVLSIGGTFSTIVFKTVETLLIAAVFWAVANSTVYLRKALNKRTSRTDAHIGSLATGYICTAAKAIIFVLGALCVLQVWISDITSLIAGLSIGGIAFALAAQDTAANLFGSITVMLDRPFDIGEYIEIAGVAGTVEQMGMRSTRIRTLDNSLVIIPNKTMSDTIITNWTKIDRRRILLTVGVTYDATSAQLEELIARIDGMLKSRTDIRQEGIAVGFANFGENAFEISVRFFTLNGDAGEAAARRGDVNFAILGIIREMGLSIALPSRSVYIESVPAMTGGNTGINR